MVKTYFEEVMGSSPRMKVIQFLIENDRTHWSLSELRQAGVGYSTLKILVPKLVKVGIIKVDEKVGNIKLYKLNKESKITKRIIKLWEEIIYNLN